MTYTPHQEEDEETGLILKIVSDDDTNHLDPAENDEAIIFAVLHGRYVNPAASRGLTDQESIARFRLENPEWNEYALYLYDHSGTTYRAGERITRLDQRPVNPFSGRLAQGHAEFDSGRVGSIFIKRGDFKRGKAKIAADEFCETYTAWANGDVYGYVIEDADGYQLDSCWGYIGDCDGRVLSEGRAALAHEVVSAKETQAKAQAEANALDVANLEASRPDLYAVC